MTHNAAVDTKMKYLNEVLNPILVSDNNNKKQVVLLHTTSKNLGGMTINHINKVAVLFGLGPEAQVVALDADAAIASQSKCIQSATNILAVAAIDITNLCAFQAPGQGDYNLNRLSMFTPAPFLQKAILKAMTPCPLEIIKAAIASHTLFVQEHKNDDSFITEDLRTEQLKKLE